jgi:hypothetical protein
MASNIKLLRNTSNERKITASTSQQRRLAMSKKLEHQIEKHLIKLQKLIETIGNHDIHPDDPTL